MGRLIDADVAWRKLQYRLKAYGNGHMCKKYKEMLDSIPTAYNVDAVVAELEKASKTMMPVISTKDAIDIVKRGVVS